MMYSIYPRPGLKKIVISEVEAWVNSKKQRNLSMLARLSGVSYTTLHRLFNGKNIPHLETLVPVLVIVCSQEKFRHILEVYFPGFLRAIENHYQISIKQSAYDPHQTSLRHL